MNKEIFNNLIRKTNDVGPEYKENLKKILDTFPYATNIRLLYLSSLLNDADILFEQELKKTAAYISDRNTLKNLIYRPSNSEDYIINDSPLKVIPKLVKKEDSKIKPPISDNEDKSRPINIKRTNGETIRSNKKEEKNNKSLKADEINKDSVVELDNLIINSAINASISLDIDKGSKEKSEEEVNQKSFLEWIEATKVEKIKPVLSIQQEERIKFRQKAEVLIDQFIQNQPKIKPKTEFYSPENMAKKSIEDSEEIVTETLAKIYFKQGNIAKAKSIYNKLILKNPEKKSYFASLIKEMS
tara:strand:- start:194 stop:1093 length:900 start_codon:yes stop_codon:yes gene_type:complete